MQATATPLPPDSVALLRTDATIEAVDDMIDAPPVGGAVDPTDERQRILQVPRMGAELTDETIPARGVSS